MSINEKLNRPNPELRAHLQQIRINAALGAISIIAAICARDARHDALVDRMEPRRLAVAILAAIDSGGTLDEATAAVIATMEGD